MLPDFERKLLRILYNFFAQHRRMPSMVELTARTGRRRHDIMQGLLNLEKDKYVYWDDKSSVQTVVIIEGWERQERNLSAAVRPIGGGDLSYWTDY
ncbi:hypothetical protein Q5741_09655 [Paenibacillus sp. JX-17]|uniref:Uncharacterized protein n=1 Tax=Paenibacillus lacisoli TaxID=3064525 RepID=A0ABT9CG88_9BACL|nr:hypothetical protein [Paenibacillus sp. JX-17]MDO7906686.1 hypothetical protein [Paenibacillus sp. JX-17]